MFGKENFWFVVSSSPEMSPSLMKEIQDHYTSLGFTASVAIQGISPIIFKKLTVTPCTDKMRSIWNPAAPSPAPAPALASAPAPAPTDPQAQSGKLKDKHFSGFWNGA